MDQVPDRVETPQLRREQGDGHAVLRILADEGLVRVVPRWGTFRAEGN
jgi:hypothetical protein